MKFKNRKILMIGVLALSILLTTLGSDALAKFNYSKTYAPKGKLTSTRKDEVAREVMYGVWGNGLYRKKSLNRYGYTYRTIQDRVNELIYGKKSKKVKTVKSNKFIKKIKSTKKVKKVAIKKPVVKKTVVKKQVVKKQVVKKPVIKKTVTKKAVVKKPAVKKVVVKKPIVKKSTSNYSGVSKTKSPSLYNLSYLRYHGIVNWNGYKYTYYSQRVLPGQGLRIPGRHINKGGYVADKDGYIVLANDRPKGTVLPTPFGYMGKVYDRGTYGNHIDVYTR